MWSQKQPEAVSDVVNFNFSSGNIPQIPQFKYITASYDFPVLSDEKSFIKPCYQCIIITACVVALIIAFVLPSCIYKRWPLNVLESLFILNLGVVSGLFAIFCCINSITPHSKFSYKPQYFVYPSVTLTMVLFAGILIYHCMKQLKSYYWFQKVLMED